MLTERVGDGQSSADYDGVFARLECGDTQVVVSGGDLPRAIYEYEHFSCLVMARPTWSAHQYVRQLVCGLRPGEDKADCLVFDLAIANYNRPLVSVPGLFGIDEPDLGGKTPAEWREDNPMPTRRFPDDAAPSWTTPQDILAAPKGDSMGVVSTGYVVLDRATGGGFCRGTVNVLAGRTGSAKSTLICNMIRRAALLGECTLFFKLEEPMLEGVTRIRAAMSQVDFRELLDGEVGKDSQASLDASSVLLSELPLRISDAHKLDVIERVCTQHADAGGALVFIDQLSMVETDEAAGYSRATAVSGRLRILARDLNLAIIAVSQINRAAADSKDRLGASDLRDSGHSENDAAIVMMIDAHLPSSKGNAQFLSIVIPKNRYAAVVTDPPIVLEWFPGTCRIEEPARQAAQQ